MSDPELDARDEWFWEHEVGIDPALDVVNMIGGALMHVEFALSVCERVPAFLYPLGFDEEQERLQYVRNALQRILEERVDSLDAPDRLVAGWPADVAEHGPFEVSLEEYGEYLDLVEREQSTAVKDAEVELAKAEDVAPGAWVNTKPL